MVSLQVRQILNAWTGQPGAGVPMSLNHADPTSWVQDVQALAATAAFQGVRWRDSAGNVALQWDQNGVSIPSLIAASQTFASISVGTGGATVSGGITGNNGLTIATGGATITGGINAGTGTITAGNLNLAGNVALAATGNVVFGPTASNSDLWLSTIGRWRENTGGAAAVGPAWGLAREWTPEQFGAKRNGVTDDTAAIQAALDAAANNGGGTIRFSRGIYLISDTLNLTHKIGLRLVGQGASVSLTGTVLQLSSTWSKFHVLDLTNASDVYFERINFYGDPAPLHGGLKTGAFIAPVTGGETQKIVFYHCTFSGPFERAAIYAWGVFFLDVSFCGLFPNDGTNGGVNVGPGTHMSQNYALTISGENWAGMTSQSTYAGTAVAVLGNGGTGATSFTINCRNHWIRQNLISNQAGAASTASSAQHPGTFTANAVNTFGMYISAASDIHLISNEITAGPSVAAIRIFDAFATKPTEALNIERNWFGGMPQILVDGSQAATMKGVHFIGNRVDPIGAAPSTANRFIIRSDNTSAAFSGLVVKDTIYISNGLASGAFISLPGATGASQIQDSELHLDGNGIAVSGVIDYRSRLFSPGTVSCYANKAEVSA